MMQPDPSLPAPPPPDPLQDGLRQVAAREVEAGSAKGLLAAVLARIDETMLPRVVTLEVEGQPLIRLELARRALVALDWHGHHWPGASSNYPSRKGSLSNRASSSWFLTISSIDTKWRRRPPQSNWLGPTWRI